VKPLRLGTVSVCMLQALGIAMSRMRAAAGDSAAGVLKTWLKGKRVMVVDDTLINRWALGHPGPARVECSGPACYCIGHIMYTFTSLSMPVLR
jgi:hypothetical protein